MSDNIINPLNQSLLTGASQKVEAQNNASAKDASKRSELSQEAFLKLLITQLKSQDPMNPQDPGQFMTDMAQFGTLDGIGKLSKGVNDLATHFQSHRALQASSMVGRNVRVESQIAHLGNGEELTAMIDVPTKVEDLTVKIYNSLGKEVHSVPLNQKEKGMTEFTWDGKDSTGKLMPEGRYILEAKATIGGNSTNMTTYIDTNVDSVLMDKGKNFVLNLKGIGPVSFDKLTKIDS